MHNADILYMDSQFEHGDPLPPSMAAILYLNVRPLLRQGKSGAFWAKVMAAEIYQDFIPTAASP
jgi:hypothetical protein